MDKRFGSAFTDCGIDTGQGFGIVQKSIALKKDLKKIGCSHCTGLAG